MYDRVMTRETHVHSCRTGKNKLFFSFNFSGVCHSYFHCFSCLSCLFFSTLLPFILRLSFPCTWNQLLFFPVIKDTLPEYLPVHIYCIHSIHLDPRFEYSIPYGWADESSIRRTHRSQAIPLFFPIVFNKFIQVSQLPHIELICGYKLWSLPFFLPLLNLKSVNWWLWLEVTMTFLSFFLWIKMSQKAGRTGCPGKWGMSPH